MIRAPFPYYGGKALWAETVWQHFGKVDVYAEPFAGSLAVLLNNPSPARREVVCDTDSLICNFWRALINDPEATAHYADWPAFHPDLTSRHKWLIAWRLEHAHRLMDDAEFYDCKVAGWWVWGIANYIGTGWCANPCECHPRVKATLGNNGVQSPPTSPDGMPHIHDQPGGRGVMYPPAPDGMPKVPNWIGGAGVMYPPSVSEGIPRAGTGMRGIMSPPNKVPRVSPHDVGTGSGVMHPPASEGMPKIPNKLGGAGVMYPPEKVPAYKGLSAGKGVMSPPDVIPCAPPKNVGSGKGVMSPPSGPDGIPQITGNRATGERGVMAPPGEQPAMRGELIRNWFLSLQRRLDRVIVLNRDWQSAVAPSVLADTATTGDYARAVFLDPPYTSTNQRGTYGKSASEENKIAHEAWEWAIKHGDKYRIAYACNEGDFDPPPGWTVKTRGFNGRRTKASRTEKPADCIMFSPACVGQASLF